MQELFLELVKLSLIGSLFALAVMLVRLVFRKAPKWLFCVLWGVVALRLICPISIESNVSLVPDRLASGQIIANVGAGYIGDVDIIYENNAGYSNAVAAGRQPVYSKDGYYVVTEKDSLEAPKTVGQTIYPILSWVWEAGMVLMLAYTAVSYLVLRKKMAEATYLRDNIWQCEQVDSPFVLGIIKPRIYLPYAITDSDMANVIAHEQAHIGRKDHWWKPIGFLLLSVHWFNPVLWVAYILLCRDIEAACDEKVIKHMDRDQMRAYSTALLHCSVHRRRIAACPLAFGETGVKERIKRVMNYKKPAFWIMVAAVVACTVAVVCFVTNPKDESSGSLPNIHSHTYVVDEVIYESGMYSFTVVAGENSPIYAISEDMMLSSQKEITEGGNWAQLGKLDAITLNEENFDELFKGLGNWPNKVTAKSVRKNTENAWKLVYNQEDIYYILQQKNGDLYLAYGYQDPAKDADPGSFNDHIRWLFKLAIDTMGDSGIIAKSGDGVVPMVSFPKGTMIKDYVDSIYWLTINPDDEEFVPFSVWKDGKEHRGFYTAYDAVTFEPLKHFIPSGLDPQTYLFQNADPTRGYIVLATFSTEPNADIYAFGAKFDDTKINNTETGSVEPNKLLSLVSEIANNPDCVASSNPFTYIEARKAEYDEILTYGSDAVDFFVEQLRAGENGLQGYIMAAACSEITGIGEKTGAYDTSWWATAQEWLALYESATSQAIPRNMTIEDVIALSKKGKDLTYEDLVPFRFRDIGSGTYIYRYDIDSDYYLIVPGGITSGPILGGALHSIYAGGHIDIRESGVEEFIKTHRADALKRAITEAIGEHYRTGIMQAQSFVRITDEVVITKNTESPYKKEITLYLLVFNRGYKVINGSYKSVDNGKYIPTMIRFGVDPAGSYKLLKYWTPSSELEPFIRKEVLEEFPEGVAEETLKFDYYSNKLYILWDSIVLNRIGLSHIDLALPLEQKYPEYFQLNTDKGLAVYIYQMAHNTYSCVLMEGNDAGYDWQALAGKPSTSMDEMRQIVQSYGLDRSKISIIPVQIPYSSYLYTIDDAYRTNLEALFWSEYKEMEYTVQIVGNYPIANPLKNTYAAGEEVTVKLETLTEHYYVLCVNGVNQEMDAESSDMEFTCFTFTMPSEDVTIQIEDHWVYPPDDPSQQQSSTDSPGKDHPVGYPYRDRRIWDRHHPDDGERYPYFSVNIPELGDTLIEYKEDGKIYMDGEYLLGGAGNGCESFYLADITGDYKPELCFGMNLGSGIVDCNIVIFDWETKKCIFSLSDRMFHDYYLFARNGVLCVKETEYMKVEAVHTGVLIYDGSGISVSWDSEVNANADRDNVPAPGQPVS